MAIWTKEVLSAWKWILGCGFIVSLLSATVNYYFFSGIAKNMALMGIFLLYSTVITLICISVFLYRNINLNGVISFWGAFSILILIFFTIVILYIPISNLVFLELFHLMKNILDYIINHFILIMKKEVFMKKLEMTILKYSFHCSSFSMHF